MTEVSPSLDDKTILPAAVKRAVDALNIDSALSAAMGISDRTATQKQHAMIDIADHLDVLMGSDLEASARWLRTYNLDFD
jgi:hypothetical protein